MLTDKILLNIEKPSRYLGGEFNMVTKDIKNTTTRFVFSYPDVYEVGMSNIGLNILYYFLNRRENTYCERVFAPWLDMEKIMRSESIPLFSLETKKPIKEYDFIGFTLQYEMSYTNIINMLDLACIPYYSKDRDESSPLIIAGGPCVYNPEPLAEIIDIFYIGEGEVMLDEILDIYESNKLNGGTKSQFLEKILHLDGVYIPKFYDVTYNKDGTINSFTKNHPLAKDKIQKVFVKDLDSMFVPTKQLVPLIETAHYRAVLELFRGCIRGCRFCQAGYTYRPVRQKSSSGLLAHGKALLNSTGYEELSLSSLSTSDYTHLLELTESLSASFSNVNISLPSLRIDGVTSEILKKVQKTRPSSITFAPEAGSQRLRDIINKDITENEIFTGTKIAFSNGHTNLKLYFMIGLPSEQYEDILAISNLASDVLSVYYTLAKENRSKIPPSITVSTSCFVPKPFTPFQWEAQNYYNQFMDKQQFLKNNITKKLIKYKYHDAKTSAIEGVISRGDRRVGAAIIEAQRLGARFDGWSEHFNYEIWQKAFAATGINQEFYTNRERQLDENLPWDHINIGVTKDFLIRELSKSKEVKITKNCREGCGFCGINALANLNNLTINCP